jgi:hypothetical protein
MSISDEVYRVSGIVVYSLGKVIHNTSVTLFHLGTVVSRAGQLVARLRSIIVVAVGCSRILHPELELR